MKSKINHVCSLLLLLLFICVLNVKISGQDPLKRFYFTDREQTSLTIPFQFINNLIIIPVSINNSDTLNFILDTGLSTTILSELKPNDSISFSFAREVHLQGVGQGEPVSAFHSYGNTIRISEIEGMNQDIYVLAGNSYNLSARMGMTVNGILGYAIFSNFVVAIDYDRRIITFYKPESFKNKRRFRNYKTYPIIMHDTKPYINVQISDNKGNTHNTKLLLDTGASHSVWLDENTVSEISIPEKSKYTFLGSGLNGKVFGVMSRFPFLEINGFQVKNPIISFPDSSSLVNAAGMDQRNGSIGSDILKRFHMVIDYKNSQIKIRPNNQYKSPFTLNLSGMEIIAPYVGLKLYFVDNVTEGSPAWEAGIRVSDELVSINNLSTTKLEMSDIYQILHSRPGKKVKLKVYRNDELITVIFRIEEFI